MLIDHEGRGRSITLVLCASAFDNAILVLVLVKGELVRVWVFVRLQVLFNVCQKRLGLGVVLGQILLKHGSNLRHLLVPSDLGHGPVEL